MSVETSEVELANSQYDEPQALRGSINFSMEKEPFKTGDFTILGLP
jgi:hypothetical protein